MRRLFVFISAFVLASASAACGAKPAEHAHSVSNVTSRTVVSSSSSSASAASRAVAKPTKMLVFVVENHSLGQMQGMSWLDSQAKRYGYANNYRGITHPSLPNYLAMAYGSTFGITDDDEPSSHPLRARSVFMQAVNHGRTARTYAESMPGTCAKTSSGDYAVKHNPWPYSVPETATCRRFDVGVGKLAPAATRNRLPNVGLVVPNLCSDAHDCSLSTADSWLKAHITPILSTKDFTSGRLAIVVTADEDDHSSGNKVLTVVMWPGLHGKVVTTALTHYSLSRSWSRLAGAKPLKNAARAADLLRAFGA